MKGLIKRTISGAMAIMMVTGTVTAEVLTSDEQNVINTMRIQADELSVLLSECEALGIPTTYEKPAEKILNQFAEFLEEDMAEGDLSRFEYTKTATTAIYNEAKTNLEAYLAGTKQARYVPQYKTSDRVINGQQILANVSGETEKRPVYFVGYGHSDYLTDFIPQFKDYGVNAVQNECGPAYCIKTTDLSEWQTVILGNGSVEKSTDVKYKGSASAKITYNEAKEGEYVSLYQYVDVEPGKTYEFKGYVKGTSVSGVALGFEESQEQKEYSGTFSNWKSFKVKYTVPQGVTRLTPKITCSDVTTAFYLDNLVVCEAGGVTNLLKNGDFESTEGLGLKFDINSVQNKIEVLNEQLKSAEENDIAFDLLLSVQKSFTADIKKYLTEYDIAAADGKILKEANNSLKYRVNHPKVNELVELYLRNYIPLIKNYKSVKSLCIANEPQLDVSGHGDYYLADWQEYLKERYTDIRALNNSYSAAYTDFSEVGFYDPDTDGAAKYYDQKKFTDGILSSWHRWMADIIKEIWPEAVVHSKIMGYTYDPNRIDNGTGYGDYTDIFDLNGCDYWNYINDDLGPLTKNMWYDYMTSLKNVPVINSEDHVIKDSNQLFSPEIAKHVGQDIYQGAIHGRAESLIWLWARGKSDNVWGSLLYRPDVIWEISKAALDLNRNAYEIAALSKQAREVGIVYSDASILNDEYAMHAVYEAYASAAYNGKRVEFATEKNPYSIMGKKLVIVPKQRYVTSDMITALTEYIKSGGRVIILDEGSLRKNEFDLENDRASVEYIFSNSDVFSYQGGEKNMISPEPYEFYGYVRDVLSEEDAYNVSVVDMSTNEPIKDAEYNTALYNGRTLVNINNYGKAKNVKIFIDGEVAAEVYDLRNNETIISGISVGQYESVTVRVEKTEKVSVQNENQYIPKRAIVSRFNRGLLLSWKNPSSQTLEKVKIYQITDTSETLLTDSISAAPSEYIHYQAENLEPGKRYRFKAVFSFSDRIDSVYYMTGVAENVSVPSGNKNVTVTSGTKKFGAWTVDIKNQSYKGASSQNPVFEKRQPFEYALDSEVKYGENGASMRIDGNAIDGESTLPFGSIYVHMQLPAVKLKANTPYKLTYRTKTDELNQYMIHMSWAKFSEDKLNTTGPANGTTDWTQHELVHITGSADELKALMLVFKYYGTLWIDDFELYEAEKLTENGKTVYKKKDGAVNLLSDGNFDEISSDLPILTGVSATKNADGDVTIEWNQPDKNLSGIKIYEYINGVYEYCGILPADANDVKLLGMRAGEHKFILYPVDEYGMVGEGVEVTSKERSKYTVKTPLTRPFNGGLVLSWRNPDAFDLRSIKIYDITDGSETLIGSPDSIVPSKYVIYSVDGLTNGNTYQYKAVFSFGIHEDKVYYFTGTPKNIKEPDSLSETIGVYEDKKKLGSWSAQIVNQSHKPNDENPSVYERRMPLSYSLDTKEKHGDSGASLRFDVNAIDYNNADTFRRMYVQVSSGDITLRANTTYKITYWAKSDNLKQLRMNFGWERFDSGSGYGDEVPVSGTTGWKQYEAIYTPQEDVTSQLIIMASDTGTVWLDDFEIYEVEEIRDSVSGKVTYERKAGAENLMQDIDCGFDDICRSVGTVDGFSALSGDGGITLTWNAQAGDVNGFNVYELVDNAYEYAGMINVKLGKAVLSGFDRDKERIYKIVAVNSYGIEGEEYNVKYQPALTTHFALVSGDELLKIDNIKSGTVRVISEFVNHEGDSNYSFAVVSALYNGSKLASVSTKELTIPENATTLSPYTYTSDFVIPDDGEDYRIKVMYWESLNSMIPVSYKELS